METKNKVFNICFLCVGLAVQVITYCLYPSSPISLISGLAGICSVLLCSMGNILTFYLGSIQILTYMYICYAERLYGGIAINIFYLFMQAYGLWVWHHRGATANQSLRTRSLPRYISILGSVGVIGLSWITGYLLSRFTDDSQPYLDSFTTIPAIAAQILLSLAYREQWFIWFVIDMLFLVVWARADNYCMFIQYAFWSINCIYGYIIWTKLKETEEK